MIEKALKKLKLDAMVIQQGRMQDSNKTVGKDDLLSMVRYGAELVFSGGGGTVTDEDIDAIISKASRGAEQTPHSHVCRWLQPCVPTCAQLSHSCARGRDGSELAGRGLLCRNMVAEGCCATALVDEELSGRMAGGRGAVVLL